MHQTFTQALIEAKRKAQLGGGQVTQQEAAGIAGGYFSGAGERMYQQGMLDLEGERLEASQEMHGEGLAAQKEMHSEGLAAQKEQWQASLAAQKKAQEADFAAQQIAYEKQAADAKSAQIASYGAMGGALIGWVFGPVGAVVGGAIGYFAGDSCIIVTACTGRNSYEVNITREYRNKFLDAETLFGYYALASIVVPVIKKHKIIKRFTKRFLVDRLVDYGEIALGKKKVYKYKTSKFVTDFFLSFCLSAGKKFKEKIAYA